MADGLTAVCTLCHTRKPAAEFPDFKYGRRQCAPCYHPIKAERSRRYRSVRRDQTARHNRSWKDAHRAARRAHDAVYRALRSGRLIRPDFCSACARKCKPQAHHEDYSRPLDVTWLCRSCHKLTHTKTRRKVPI